MAPKLIPDKVESYEAGPAYIVEVDGVRAGRVVRVRHTERLTYAYTRIGYDSTHSCWSGEKARNRVYPEILTCFPTRKAIVAEIVR